MYISDGNNVVIFNDEKIVSLKLKSRVCALQLCTLSDLMSKSLKDFAVCLASCVWCSMSTVVMHQFVLCPRDTMYFKHAEIVTQALPFKK